MTQFYGALVGAIKQLARPVSIPNIYERGTEHVLCRDRAELVAVQIGDTIQLADLPWETVLDPYACDISWDDLSAGAATMHIGITGLSTALSTSVAVGAALGTAKIMAGVDIANYFKPLWELAGHATLAAAKLVRPTAEVYATNNVAVSAGTLVWCLMGQARGS